MALFRETYRHGPYAYYHLLSGVDFPIKPMSNLRSFFDHNNGKEFVGYVKSFDMERVNEYHFFTRHLKPKGIVAKVYWKVVRIVADGAANMFWKRETDKIEMKKGCNWVSITNDFCGYLLSQSRYIRTRFRHTITCEELYKQTLLWNSPFKDRIYNVDDEYEGCMRAIDWNRGAPYVWGQQTVDFDMLMKSDKLFARKFDENLSGDLVGELIAEVCKDE